MSLPRNVILREDKNEEEVPKTDTVNTAKKTFKNIKNPRVSVSDNIKKFQDLLKGGDCVIGGGYCVKHNEKLVREVKTRRMSTTNKNGDVVWTTGEVTILACPVSTRQAGHMSAGSRQLMTSQPSERDTSNKKLRIFEESDMNQSTESIPDKRAIDDILLDKQNSV